ncbi:metallophosphoesterase [Lysinibacillus louembei]|uniref:Phosphoesterase n=1 Tax=Lysinibacillus louembei TaxID=1470088 RepID=A0ABZ0RU55_9BACI|nr:metallophosphoesterase [Lysinibacillus louembei]WPK10736.1 metallophosphoesterase [Lysinibacillus louembei]
MKILVMSDTHGDAEVIRLVRSQQEDSDIVIHCGDSELSYDHPNLADVVRVRGNCDYTDNRFPDEDVIIHGHVKIYVTHGHLFQVKSSLLALSYRAKELGANICCFGHSHVLGAEMIDDILFINPGSLLMPRGRREQSYVVLTVEQEAYKVECFTRQGELFETLHFNRH